MLCVYNEAQILPSCNPEGHSGRNACQIAQTFLEGGAREEHSPDYVLDFEKRPRRARVKNGAEEDPARLWE